VWVEGVRRRRRSGASRLVRLEPVGQLVVSVARRDLQRTQPTLFGGSFVADGREGSLQLEQRAGSVVG
jgi:hypothetical protein